MDHFKRKEGKILLGERDLQVPQTHWRMLDDSFSFKGKKIILHFPGDGTNNAEVSNGSVKCIIKTLAQTDLRDVKILSAYYENILAAAHRIHQLRAVGELKDSLMAWPDISGTPTPYFDSFFHRFFAPLVMDEQGGRYSLAQAKKNMQNLIIVGHCHGTAVAFEMERMLLQQMQKLGYTQAEQTEIQRQLVIVACTSRIPIGHSKSTILHVTSFFDPQKGPNWKAESFQEFLNTRERKKQKSTLVFQNDHEVILSGDKLLRYELDEHDFRTYFDDEKKWFEKTPVGESIRTIIRSFIETMVHAEERPSLFTVFERLPEQAFLNEARTNGEILMREYDSYLEKCRLSRTQVFECIRQEDINALNRLILEKGVVLTLPNEAGDFPVHAALRTGNSELVSAVIAKDRLWFQSVNAQGETPLSMVLKQGKFKTAHFLWQKMEHAQLLPFDKYGPLREIQRRTVLWTIRNLHVTPLAVYFLGTLLSEHSLRIRPEDILLVVQKRASLQKAPPFPHQTNAVNALNHFIYRFIKESHESELFKTLPSESVRGNVKETVADVLSENLKEDIFQSLLLKRRETFRPNNRIRPILSKEREMV